MLVAAAAHDPGQLLTVRAVDWPAALVPAGAVSDVDDGAVARLPLAAGDPIRAADVAAPGPLALVPDGWLAVPMIESPVSGATIGDRVQVVSEGVVIAPDAVVVGFVDDAILVAAPAESALLLALAPDVVLLR